MDGNIEKMQSLTGRIKGLGIDKTLTKKGMCAEAEATGEALATKVNITDIVDDLTSVADDKPLSANQGRVLKKQIDEIDPHYAENVIYDDTNVKDAIDKLSKAENIAYDEEKSVQGAIDELNENVADVQTQLDTKLDTKLNKTVFSSNGVPPYNASVIQNGATLEIGLRVNKIFLVTLFNEFNESGVYLVETGTAVSGGKAKITSIKSSNYFTLTGISKTNITVKCSGATAMVSYLCLGGSQG